MSQANQPLEDAYVKLLLAGPEVIGATMTKDYFTKSDPQTLQLIQVVAGRARNVLAAIAQAHGIIDKLEVTLRMLRRSSWGRRSMTRAQHLELHWFLFENLTYSFKEKIKLIFNCEKEATDLLVLSPPTWLKPELATLDRTIRQHLVRRGNTIHGWDERHGSISHFDLIESLAKIAPESKLFTEMPGLRDLEGHHADVRYDLAREAQTTIKAVKESLFKLLCEHRPFPIEILNTANELILNVREGKVKLRPGAER